VFENRVLRRIFGPKMGEMTGDWRKLHNEELNDHFGDPGLDWRIILRWIVRKWDVGLWTRSSWLRIGTGGGHL
jgi:hypothetical protein